MKKRNFRIWTMALAILLAMMTGCEMTPEEYLEQIGITLPTVPVGGAAEAATKATSPDQDDPEATTAPDGAAVPEETVSATEPVVTDPVATDPVVTEPLVTEPAVTEPVVTEPPVTDPPETEPVVTEPPHQHSYSKETVEPTCDSRGYTKYTCSCGNSYKDNYISELGHSWSDWTVTQEPTFKEYGKKQRSCSACGDVETQKIDKLDAANCSHNYEDEVIQGTCESEGYTEHTCTECGHSYRDTYTEKGEHIYYVNKPDEYKEATQEEEGYKIYSCIYCDHVETIVIPKLEKIDTAALEAYARRYARDTYGYDGNPNCLPENEAGYFPAVTWTIRTMEEGYEMARWAIDSQYRQDVGGGRVIIREDESGNVYYRRPVNVYFEPTSDPNVFRIWTYYGGACEPSWK